MPKKPEFSKGGCTMAMRLYHRRSSSSKHGLQVQNTLLPSLRLGSAATNSSMVTRPRSQSLFPGGDATHCLLAVPQRSRSMSFSGSDEIERLRLTASEEENIFKCYARVMYVILGSMGAALLCVAAYALFSVCKAFPW